MFTGKYRIAYELAERYHRGQFRKGGEPYITHPAAVAEMMISQGRGDEYVYTALFHDLLEDTEITEQEIADIGGEAVLRAVKLLTKTKGYDMAEYISGIKSDPIAFAVKGADRLHNLRSAFAADEAFIRRYIKESLEWYLDFSPEIPEAVRALCESIGEPFPEDL